MKAKRIRKAWRHFRTNAFCACRTAAEYIKAYPELRREEALTVVDVITIVSAAGVAISTITFYAAMNILS